MLQLRITPCLLAGLSLLPSVIHAAACTRPYIAKAGDSCATVSAAYGITVTQFINLNPTLTNCALVASTSYCTSDNPADAVPTTSASSPGPVGTLVPSPDGSEGVCGGAYTCLGSVYGSCCSAAGYCGDTTEYCGDGCNPLFGNCGGGTPGTPVGTTAVPGTTATRTITITAGPGTCAATTRTVTLPAGTVTATATRTVTGPASTVVQTSTITSVRSVTVTATVTAAPGPPKPSPTAPGTYKNCSQFAQWKATDRCARFLSANYLSLEEFEELNPNFDCYDPQVGYYVCVSF